MMGMCDPSTHDLKVMFAGPCAVQVTLVPHMLWISLWIESGYQDLDLSPCSSLASLFIVKDTGHVGQPHPCGLGAVTVSSGLRSCSVWCVLCGGRHCLRISRPCPVQLYFLGLFLQCLPHTQAWGCLGAPAVDH